MGVCKLVFIGCYVVLYQCVVCVSVTALRSLSLIAVVETDIYLWVRPASSASFRLNLYFNRLGSVVYLCVVVLFVGFMFCERGAVCALGRGS